MVSAKDQIISGISSYRKAFKVIKEAKMGKLFIFPLVFSIVIMILLLSIGYGSGAALQDLIHEKMQTDNAWLSVLTKSIEVIATLLAFIVFIYLGGTIVNILMSPIYTIMSEKTDTYLTGREYNSNIKQTIKDIGRTLIITLKNTIKQFILLLLCLLLNLIPLIGTLLSVVMIYIINAYYFGYGFMDYTNERAKRNEKLSSKITYRYKYLAITIGAIYTLPLYLICGTFLLAVMGGISTVAATIAQIELESKDPELQTLIQK
jgi:CysZ protein